VLVLLLRLNGNSEGLHRPATAAQDAYSVNRETGIVSGDDQVFNEMWNLFWGESGTINL